MTLIVGLAAFSIDAARWQVTHHQAQVAADATALAAANCLASTKCTQTTTTGDAATKADAIANQNGFPNSAVSISFTSSTVTVSVSTAVSSTFATLFGISATTSARATASYNTNTSYSSTCAVTGSTSCLSLFAGNPLCPSSSPSYNVGLDLVTNDSGGGSSTMSNVFTNGYYYNDASSGSYSGSYVSCAQDFESKPNRSNFTTVPATLPYPEPWSKPSCTNTAASWTSFSGPGVYCVTSGPSGGCSSTGSNTSTGSTSGYIDVNMSSLPSGAYEFVGPCVVLNGSNSNVTNISGQPLVYGTSNITTMATSTALPTCTLNDGSNGTSTWLTGNGSSLEAPIYDQCGTFEETGNNGFIGFVEAWNIAIDKNNTITGDGPASASGGGVTITPGGDSLTS